MIDSNWYFCARQHGCERMDERSWPIRLLRHTWPIRAPERLSRFSGQMRLLSQTIACHAIVQHRSRGFNFFRSTFPNPLMVLSLHFYNLVVSLHTLKVIAHWPIQTCSDAAFRLICRRLRPFLLGTQVHRSNFSEKWKKDYFIIARNNLCVTLTTRWRLADTFKGFFKRSFLL